MTRGSHNWLIHELNQKIAEGLTYRGRVVDLGCGTAPYRDLILQTADEYIGVDWVESLHDRSHVDVNADLNQPLPFASEFADTVVSFQVLEHIANPTLLLSEAHRILKPGGALHVTVPFMWHIHEAPHDYFRYTEYGLRHILEGAGFTGIDIVPNTGFWQTWFLKLNYQTVRFARGPLSLPLRAFWRSNQILAPVLDRLDPQPAETASYTVTARRAR
ncbi:MAG: class I SAM-dependent methyltransferase [Sandaracinaceae bacterium]|nr:MAG: class I SAM-dependent methyltransferase [Sandaracinaceae bacterium]